MMKKILGTIALAAVSEVLSDMVINGAEHIVRKIKKEKIEIDAEEVNEIGTVEMYQDELRWAVQA